MFLWDSFTKSGARLPKVHLLFSVTSFLNYLLSILHFVLDGNNWGPSTKKTQVLIIRYKWLGARRGWAAGGRPMSRPALIVPSRTRSPRYFLVVQDQVVPQFPGPGRPIISMPSSIRSSRDFRVVQGQGAPHFNAMKLL